MQLLNTSLMVLTAALLFSGNVAAQTTDKAFRGIVVQGSVSAGTVPEKLQVGSITYRGKDGAAMTGLAKIDSAEASNIALMAFPGRIFKAELESEKGFLIWTIELITPASQVVELLIDAGNGNLLAVELNDDDDEDEDD